MDMEKDGKDAMKRLAMNKAKKRKILEPNKSQVGKRLDRLEMRDAPRRPFIERFTRKGAPRGGK